MSEYINNTSERRKQLLDLALGILQGKRNPTFVKKFDAAIENMSPRDVIHVVDGMVRSGAEMEPLKKAVSQVLNLMHSALQHEGERDWNACPFIEAMVDENREMEKRMKAIKQLVKSINVKGVDASQFDHLKAVIREKLSELSGFDTHYSRKENILFPYLEKKWSDFRCLQVMWSLHDDVRAGLKLLDELLADEEMTLEEFNYAIGALYFSVYPLIYREEHILFPVAWAELDKSSWDEMLTQSSEIGYAFIPPPVAMLKKENGPAVPAGQPIRSVDLHTGVLEADQLIGLLNHLPVDITFVDHRDEVRYFNQSKERHFPRSKAIIGRKVQNCHPPESIDLVNQIIQSFRQGEKEEEAFWIQMKGKFIHIRYFAIRNVQGEYMGALEVSQDITGIRNLEGEKRLIN